MWDVVRIKETAHLRVLVQIAPQFARLISPIGFGVTEKHARGQRHRRAGVFLDALWQEIKDCYENSEEETFIFVNDGWIVNRDAVDVPQKIRSQMGVAANRNRHQEIWPLSERYL